MMPSDDDGTILGCQFPQGEVHLHCRHAAGEIARCLIARTLNENCVASGKRGRRTEVSAVGGGLRNELSMSLALKVLQEQLH